jgi:hypothetical protein
MSSLEVFSGAGSGAAGGPGGCKRGRLLGSRNEVKDPVATLPVPQRRGRPPGSRNKKTLEALVATAAAEPSGVSHPTAITVAPGGVTALATALVGAVMAVGAAPPGLIGRSVGGSSSTAVGKVRKPWCPPPEQRLSYTLKHGYTTTVVHLLDGYQDHLPLPASFVGTMGKDPPMSIMVEEGSGGQPLYLVEILHDEQGKSYLTEGWTKFLDDYDLKWGWSLILTHHARSPILCVRVVDASGCARAYSRWP